MMAWWRGSTQQIDVSKIIFQRDDDHHIGSGAFGSVYRVEHAGTNIAVKVIDVHKVTEYTIDAGVLKSEILPFLKKIQHPNIITIYDCKYVENEMQIAMQYCKTNLQTFSEATTEMGASLTANILWQASNGLSHLHDMDIVHRDIKPNNFLVHFEDDVKLTIKLTDFSFAKDFEKQKGSTMTTVRGNRHWLAPELVDDEGKKVEIARYKRSVDVFSFGLTILFVIANIDGKNLFTKTKCNRKIFGKEIKLGNDIVPQFKDLWRIHVRELEEKLSPLLDQMLIIETANTKRPNMKEVTSKLSEILSYENH